MITLRPIERPWAKPARPPLQLALAALIAAVALTGVDIAVQLRARPAHAEPTPVVAPVPPSAPAAAVRASHPATRQATSSPGDTRTS